MSTAEIEDLRASLCAVADPARAQAMSHYVRDRYPFLGVTSPDRRSAQRTYLADAAAAGPDACVAAAKALWGEPEREFQYVGCDLLRRVAERLPASSLEDLRHLVGSKSWWDTVDSLAKVVGAVVVSHPERAGDLDAWVMDDDMWIARAAILHQLGRKEETDPEVLFRYCRARIDDRDFFIRKAIGWALRDMARSFPDEVWGWVDAHPELSGLSQREATKHR